jgi:putative ABC transport system permease protein
MPIWPTLFIVEAVRSLARHRLRSGLAAIGVMIGVAAVIWVVDIGTAGTERAIAELQKLGDNLVWVEAGSRNVSGVRTGTHGAASLMPEDADAIRREIGAITRVSENVDGRVQVVLGTRNWNTQFRGVSPEYQDIKLWRMAEGGFFTAEQVENRDNVVVIGETVRRELFEAADPLGATIRIRTMLFRVIGLLAAKGQSGTGQDQDDVVMMPWTTAQERIRGRGSRWLDDILCSAVSRGAVEPAVARVTALMRQRHRIQPGDEDDFNVRRPDDLINAQIRASRTLAQMLATMAAISLLVGGIGIMNVMLASVAQRTKEIGLRLAVGATPTSVQVQFIGEAVAICLFGGLLGIVLNPIGGAAIESLLGWPLATAPATCVLALGFSVAVGMVFGFYPAWQASRLDPIAALHSE